MNSIAFNGPGHPGGQGSADPVVVWQWCNDQGDWSVYEAIVSNYIEACYSSSQPVVDLKDIDPNLRHLRVSFADMVQRSAHGSERPIKRDLYDGNSAVAHGAIWQWGKEQAHQRVKQYIWQPYSMEVANMLEAAYSAGAKYPVDLDVSPINEPYVVDLNSMQQINKTSRFSRPVQRVRTNGTYRTVSNAQQMRPASGWLGSSSRFGGSSMSVASSSVPSAYGHFGAGPSLPIGSAFNFSNNFSVGMQPGSRVSGNVAGANFNFTAPLPVGQSSFQAPSSAQPIAPRRAKRVRTLVRNQPSTVNSNHVAAPSTGFSFGDPSSSSSTWPLNNQSMVNMHQNAASNNWNVSANSSQQGTPSSTWPPSNQPMLNMQQMAASNNWSAHANLSQQGATSNNWSSTTGAQTSGPSHASGYNAFSSYRNPTSQSVNGNSAPATSASLGQSQSSPSSGAGDTGAAAAGGPSSGSNRSSSMISSAIASMISGFSNMAVISYRYITTGGKSNQSGSSNNSLIPAQSADVVTQSTAKPGARSKGSSGQNAKRRKLAGEDTITQDDLSFIQKLTARDVLKRYIKEVPKPPQKEDCCICFDSLREASGYGQGDSYTVVQLTNCSHMFHIDCLSAMYDSSSKNGSIQCPKCKTIYGTKYGNCPNGFMKYSTLNCELPGYQGCTTFEIRYSIQPGLQSAVHPNPGCPYKIRGFPRVCYLPNNQEGQKVLDLLIVAWKRRLTFTIGQSVTTGEPDVVVWNEIHHKTEMANNSGHGYPDPKYLSNVLAELAAQGVTDDDSS